jgi:ADP-ribose pyrophosphatase YjhB (NUDIX family)
MHDVAVGMIIRHKGGIVIVKDALGWALPGGPMEAGESLEQAAIRCARAQTCLELRHLQQMHTYSGERPGCKTITTVFVAEGKGELRAESSNEAKACDVDELPELAYDHKRIILDYQNGEYLGMD